MQSRPGRFGSWAFALTLSSLVLACATRRSSAPPAVKPATTSAAPGPAVGTNVTAPELVAPNAEKLWQQMLDTCEAERKNPCAPSLVREAAEAERRVNGKKPECEKRVPSLCEKAAQQTVAALPTDRELRERCARFVYDRGYTRTAAEILGAIASSAPEASRLLLVAAEMHLSVAKEGPNYRRFANGMFVFHPSKDADADKRWVEAELEAAATAASRAVALLPGNADALGVLATVREQQKQPAQALAALETAPSLVSGNVALTAQRARLLAELGRDREAVAGYRAALLRDEFASESWRALANLHEKLGEQNARKQAEERADYFGFLMPSSRLPFSVARAEKARILASHFGKNARAEQERWQSTFAALDRARDEEAAELLASFVRWHSHDDAEERAFAALERQGSKVAPILIRLVRGADSVCTIRQALAILSRLRPVHPEFPALALQALERDQNPFFPIDAARALARLGDAKAVTPLLAATGCEPLVRQEERKEIPDRVRGESLLALAALDGASARACIEDFRARKGMARYAVAATCLARGEDKACRELVKDMRTDCSDTYFADAAIVGFLDDWSLDRPERKKWSEQVAASFKRCAEESAKQEQNERSKAAKRTEEE